MTSSNGNIFRVTGPLCGEFTGPGEFSTQRPVTRSFDVFFDLRLNKRLSKQPWGWWFETLSWSLWRHCNGNDEFRNSGGVTIFVTSNQQNRCKPRTSLIVRFMGPTWGPSGADRTQVGPILAPWNVLSGISRSMLRSVLFILMSPLTVVTFACTVMTNAPVCARYIGTGKLGWLRLEIDVSPSYLLN